jgi:hypothetical protein
VAEIAAREAEARKRAEAAARARADAELANEASQGLDREDIERIKKEKQG